MDKKKIFLVVNGTKKKTKKKNEVTDKRINNESKAIIRVEEEEQFKVDSESQNNIKTNIDKNNKNIKNATKIIKIKR